MAIEIIVPTLGESVSDATVARWIKTTGDIVAVDEPIVELETDKVTLEVPAPAAGQIGDIVAAGGTVVRTKAVQHDTLWIHKVSCCTAPPTWSSSGGGPDDAVSLRTTLALIPI